MVNALSFSLFGRPPFFSINHCRPFYSYIVRRRGAAVCLRPKFPYGITTTKALNTQVRAISNGNDRNLQEHTVNVGLKTINNVKIDNITKRI
jgi:hypothetical protein